MAQLREKLHSIIYEIAARGHRYRIALRVMMAVVVFVTSYMLILPAVTLDSDTASSQGGIDVPAFEVSEENTADKNPEHATADTEDTDTSKAGTEYSNEEYSNDPDNTSDTDDSALAAGDLEYSGEGYKIKVDDDSAVLPEDTTLKVSEITEKTDPEEYEKLLRSAEKAVKDNADSDEVPGITFARFYDISFVSGGEEIIPEDTVKVTISYDRETREELMAESSDDVRVIHFAGDPDPEKSEPEILDDSSVEIKLSKDGLSEAAFKADSFSVYAVLGTTLEKNILTEDGHNYKVSVTFGPESGVPAGAGLEVSEIKEDDPDYSRYIENSEAALGWKKGSSSYAKVLDISIVDKNGDKVKIDAPVDVRIELDDRDSVKSDIDTQVVHFSDGTDQADVVSNVAVDGKTISFEAEGFSAYAIVDAPDPAGLGWKKATSVDDLNGNSFYIGHTDGYFFMNTMTGNNTRMGITKTKPATDYPDPSKAAEYTFEKVPGTDNQFYIYCYDNNGNKKYVYNGGNNSLRLVDESDKTAFTVNVDSNGQFMINNGEWYWNMQGGANGTRFCSYNSATDPNNNLYIWYYEEVTEDPYDLDGKQYGLINWNGGPAGKAMMSEPSSGHLEAKSLTVMTKTGDDEDKLFIPKDADISMWKFNWNHDDYYYLTADIEGTTQYLKMDRNGLSLVSSESDASLIHVVPGTGVHAGEICLKTGDTTLTYSGDIDTGFGVNGSTGSEWLNLAVESELTEDYFMTHSASKVSVSDTSKVATGSKIIVYTRSWNESTKKYEYYAIDHDGSLVRCFESGDSIEWVGGLINTMLWQFTEYTEADGVTPNYFYELYNEYSNKFLAPQISDGQIVADDPIGINLNGRRLGQYYSSILAWDDPHYTYAGLKVENGKIVSCPKAEAMDFYFAIMEDIPVDDVLHTVPTVDHTKYGITMKIKDFGSRAEMSDFLGSDEGGAVTKTVDNLLSTNIGDDGYPIAAGGSLGNLFSGAEEVNHLFIESTYQGTGYYEFDSSQNFASLGNPELGSDCFTVYKELGTYDSAGSRPTLKHGQFFPFNDIEPGVFASVNGKNMYTATGAVIPDDDPRKNEQLYLIKNVDTYYGVELEASFIQTPDGLDAWGHDIIYEFTGDDDFWLYVDGERIIDLGGIHSALPGSVNFRTGDVYVNGKHSTLRELFENNYRTRNPGATEADVAEFLSEYFDEGSTIFKDDTTHTMRIFYMERGAGAANLHMRFNLASIKPGTVLLSKELSGVDNAESILAEFPYQIKYMKDGREHYLTNASASSSDPEDHVFYKDTVTPVKYLDSLDINGTTYENVFMLKPGETAEIDFTGLGIDDPKSVQYSIVECCVDSQIYDKVYVNGTEIPGDPVHGQGFRKDYETGFAQADKRAKAAYNNHVNKNALHNFTFDKRLFAENGTTPIHYNDDQTKFKFRLYFGTEFDDDIPPANMHTYHVKDPDGNYCRWDKTSQNFVSLGKSDYDQLTESEKQSATFTTSMTGTISYIPVDHTVEIREVLASTKFRIVERPGEIPDGYSFQKYLYQNQVVYNAEAGVTGTVGKNEHNTHYNDHTDPHIDICNLKGWGLRVNKTWSDADYMSDRDPVYFAVFTRDEDDDLTLVDGSVRQMPYGTDSLYWYFRPLPVSVPFDNYEIREVKLGNNNPTVAPDGTVTDYGSITPVEQGGEITVNGKQKGEHTSSGFTYTVLYRKGEYDTHSNVRVDHVTNNRPGIELRKTDWDGTPLEGAEFTLMDQEGELIGKFTSDENGLITVAFLRDDITYILTETKTPEEYHGLESHMNIILSNGTVSVSGVDPDYYELEQAGGTTPLLTIKNRPLELRAVKIDGDTEQPLEGVKFSLYKQVTVDGQTNMELMTGYSGLTTDENGIIPKIDETLAHGIYELREDSTLPGYEMLSSYIRFTITQTGMINLGRPCPDDVTLIPETSDDGTITYTMTIPNTSRKKVRFMKVDVADTGKMLEGAVFDLYSTDAQGQIDELLYSGLKSGSDGILKDQTTGQSVFELRPGVYQMIETQAPKGYNVRVEPVIITITTDSGSAGVTYNDGTAYSQGGEGLSYENKLYTLKITNSAGTELPNTGGSSSMIFYIAGSIILAMCAAVMLIRRRRQQN